MLYVTNGHTPCLFRRGVYAGLSGVTCCGQLLPHICQGGCCELTSATLWANEVLSTGSKKGRLHLALQSLIHSAASLALAEASVRVLSRAPLPDPCIHAALTPL